MKVVYSSIIKVAMLFMTLGFVACDSINTNSSDKHNDVSTRGLSPCEHERIKLQKQDSVRLVNSL